MHPGQLHLAIPRWVGAVSTSRQHRKLGTSEQAHRVMHEPGPEPGIAVYGQRHGDAYNKLTSTAMRRHLHAKSFTYSHSFGLVRL